MKYQRYRIISLHICEQNRSDIAIRSITIVVINYVTRATYRTTMRLYNAGIIDQYSKSRRYWFTHGIGEILKRDRVQMLIQRFARVSCLVSYRTDFNASLVIKSSPFERINKACSKLYTLFPYSYYGVYKKNMYNLYILFSKNKMNSIKIYISRYFSWFLRCFLPSPHKVRLI